MVKSDLCVPSDFNSTEFLDRYVWWNSGLPPQEHGSDEEVRDFAMVVGLNLLVIVGERASAAPALHVPR